MALTTGTRASGWRATVWVCVLCVYLDTSPCRVNAQRFALRSVATISRTPAPRYSAAIQSFANSNDVVLFGGRTKHYAFGDTWTYNASDNIWKQWNLSRSPSPRFDALSVAIDFGGKFGKYMYVIGGRDTTGVIKTSLIWAYHLSTRSWAEVSVNSSVSSASAVVDALGRSGAAGGATSENEIVVSHGYDGSNILSNAHSIAFLSPTVAQLQRIAYPSIGSYSIGDPHALHMAGSVMTPANELIISGGCYERGMCPSRDAWSLDGDKHKWRYLARGPSPRLFPCLANALPSMTLNGSMPSRQAVVMWGGLETGKQTIQVDQSSPLEVDILNIRNNTWSRELATGDGRQLVKRYGAGMVPVGDGSDKNPYRYLIMGGISASQVLSTDILELSFDVKAERVMVSTRSANYWSYLFLHGAFMWVAYGVLMPIGVFASRYMRTLTTSPKWFYIHVTCQCLAALLACCGCVFAIVAARGSPRHLHAILGSFILALTLLQVVCAAPGLRPNPNAGVLRQVWNLLHHLTGWVVVCLAQFNIFLGMVLLIIPIGLWIGFLSITVLAFTSIVMYEIWRLSRRDHKDTLYSKDSTVRFNSSSPHSAT
jgi:Galactose oxidase, central domain/Eukaryotic cytochrome b561